MGALAFGSGMAGRPLLVAALALAACGAEDAEGEKGSGLPGELRLTSLGKEQREAFCDWFESTLPSEETCPRNTEEGEPPPGCLENFERFGSCTVEQVEACVASASASSCELPDTEACDAFRACQEGPPANDCPDMGFRCRQMNLGKIRPGPRWNTCWSWWPPGCYHCSGEQLSLGEAIEWCSQNHPVECKEQDLCAPKSVIHW